MMLKEKNKVKIRVQCFGLKIVCFKRKIVNRG